MLPSASLSPIESPRHATEFPVNLMAQDRHKFNPETISKSSPIDRRETPRLRSISSLLQYSPPDLNQPYYPSDLPKPTPSVQGFLYPNKARLQTPEAKLDLLANVCDGLLSASVSWHNNVLPPISLHHPQPLGAFRNPVASKLNNYMNWEAGEHTPTSKQYFSPRKSHTFRNTK